MSIRPHMAVAVCGLLAVFVSACGGGTTKSSLTIYEDAPTLNPVDFGNPGNKPVLRAVLGGTGNYNGAGGQLTSTRNSDRSYKQEFSLTKP
jgi:hypothetical protein